ncbi:MAG TPA: M1 family aminopeptidase [Bacteroidia bacterium]|nr:M1 family aminopeptidase [Bacteroidia bacterium]
MKSYLSKFVFTLVFLAAHLFLAAQGGNDRLNVIDVLRYDFEITLSDSTDAIQGKALVELKLLAPAKSVHLDLVGTGQSAKGMKVFGVKWADQALVYTHIGEDLEIQFPRDQAAATELKLEISYGGIPADGLIISDSKEDGRSFFGDNWPNRAHHWLPTVDHPTDKAPVGFTVFAPAHYQIVANGKLVEQKVFPDGHQVSRWNNEAPLPTKVMVIGAADFSIQSVGQVGEIPVTTWVFKKDETPGFHDYAQGKAILEWFVGQIGAYPWDKLANVQSRTRYGGMENASCIFYSDNSVTGDGSCEALMAHEIAHQWFGNSASEANWYHIWLSEGFATYWTHVYFEKVHSRDDMLSRLKKDRSAIISWPAAEALAVVDPTIPDLNMLLNLNSYEKGSWILHMLRDRVGDDAFFKGMKDYYARFKFGNALSSDFETVMEAVSAQDLGGFFQQWLYRPGFPKLDVEWKWSKGKKRIQMRIVQTQKGDAFNFPLEIGFADGDGKVFQTVNVQITSKSQEASFVLGQIPSSVVLDPNVKLLFQGNAHKK